MLFPVNHELTDAAKFFDRFFAKCIADQWSEVREHAAEAVFAIGVVQDLAKLG